MRRILWIAVLAELVLSFSPCSGVTFKEHFRPSLGGKRGLGVPPEVVSEALLGSRLEIVRTVRVDLEGGFVSREERRGDLLLAVTEVESFSQYLEAELRRKTRDSMLRYAKISLAQRKERGGGGLVPILELPSLKIPVVGGVIGEGGELRVDGSQRIEFGGRETFELDRVYEPGESPSYLPELEMKQSLLVNLEGTVGQKVHVFVDHNSEAESQLRNKIRLQYKGDEDEIVQEIEAGDTQLSLPGTKLIGGPTTHRGLFGIRALAKVGPLDMTAIASKEQAETEERSFVGRATMDSVRIWDTEFERWRFFLVDLDTMVADIEELRVFVDDGVYANNEGTFVGQYIDPQSGDTLWGDFDLKYQGVNEFYTFDDLGNVLKLRRGMEEDLPVLAVSYVRILRSGQVDTVGSVEFSPGDTLSLKVIKPKDPVPDHPTWDYELKNVYSIRSSNIIGGSFELTIYKDIPGSDRDLSSENGVPYIRLLGLDNSPYPDGDGMVDDFYVDEMEGLLWFPNRRPFCSPVLEEPDCAMYDTTDLGTGVGRKYYMMMRYKGKASIYTLGINVIEGSEEVTVGGETMERGRDYTIDYETGTVTFISERPFLYPDADINIKYQTSPFFSLTSKSLLGTRAVYKFGENSHLGTSVMYRSVGRREERPKLGEEPGRIALGEIDGRVAAQPYVFTKAVDLLPLVETETPSRFSLNAEAAASFPDPNTVGEVYIDDMEGTEVKDDLGISFTRWHFGSIPGERDTSAFCSKLQWYNPEDKVRAGDLDSLLPEDQEDDLLSVLNLVMTPDDSDTSSWGSLLTCLSTRGLDYSESKFLELWAKGENGELNLELGVNIPEDAPRRNSIGEIVGLSTLDTEDRNQDGRLDEDEDTGLDGVQGEDSQRAPGDDWNDDYHYSPGSEVYTKINGTEENDRLDTEDLDGSGRLNTDEDYCRFSISMEDSTYIARRGKSGWKLFRVPIGDSSAIDTTVGTPDWQTVRYARLWITGLSSESSIQFASLDLVGNRWREEGIGWVSGDTTGGSFRILGPGEAFYVTVKNNYQHPDYVPPYDPGRDSYGRKKKEQSLVLGFEELGSDRQGRCYSLKTRGDDYTDYREMRLYLHGDGQSSPTFFIRFGADSLNYYEYRTQAVSGWKELAVDFQTLVDLKKRLIELRESNPDTNYLSEAGYGVSGGPGAEPALTDVKRITLGVANEGEDPIGGEIWVDDIRLTGVRRDRGVSANVSLGLQLADFLSLDMSVNRSTAEFRTLGQERPSFNNTTSFASSGGANLHKFLPESWGVSLPFRAGFSRNLRYPKYYSGSDIVLNENESAEQRAVSEARNFSLDFSKSPSSNRLLQLTLDPLSIRNQVTRSSSQTYERADSSQAFSSSVAYSYSPQLKPVRLLNQELSYFPQQFGVSGGYNRNWSRGWVRERDVWILSSNPRPGRNLTGSGSFSYRPHRTVNSNYQLNVTRDLNLEDELEAYGLGREIGRNQRADASFAPAILKLLSPSLSFATSYSENHSPDQVQAPPPNDTVDVRNVGNQNRTSLNLTLNLSEAVAKLTSLRDESKDSLVGSPHWIAKQIERLSRKVVSPTGSYSIDRESQFYYVRERPSWEYQLGLREGLAEEVERIPWDEYMSKTNSYSVRSGMNLAILTVTASYSSSESQGGRGNNRTLSKSNIWPNLGVSVGPVRRLGPLKLLTDCSVSSNFTSKRDESWALGKESEMRITRSRDFRPLVGLRATLWKKVGANVNTSYTISDSEERATGNVTRREGEGASLSLAYAFSAPTGLGLPLLRRIRFQSDLSTSLDLGYNADREENVSENEVRADNVSYSATPSANYNFSQSVLGGISAEYTHRRDRKTGRATRVVGLRFSVEFKF